ncbi:UrcA family protein [Sphingobium sp. Cam5-1]|uniref:UrcA family protein n=1 Tax=Sphingobium sp. Cam5-1 TaxID=2789327 RepID=UPI001E3EFA2C|nr:UrcA family protein [Sphingobium sp. Cam5-1]
MRKSILSGSVLILSGLFMASGSTSFAQPTEEIIVTGRYSDAQSLSQNVSYADLDLSTKAGKDELRHRVALTARYLCDKLGESGSSSAVAPSCRDAAVKDAMARVGTVEEGFAPRGTTWVAGTRWQPPYPADWVEKYP